MMSMVQTKEREQYDKALDTLLTHVIDHRGRGNNPDQTDNYIERYVVLKEKVYSIGLSKLHMTKSEISTDVKSVLTKANMESRKNKRNLPYGGGRS